MNELVPVRHPLARGTSLYVSRAHSRNLLRVDDSARSMGMNIMAGKGSGKSRLMGRMIAPQDFIRGVPLVIFDPLGGTIDNFLDKIIRLPQRLQQAAWERILYVDAAGTAGMVVPMPLYYRLGTESLYTISQRYLDVVRKLDPHLQSASILGWNPLWRMGTMTGMALAALGLQITEAFGLIQQPKEFLRTHGPALSLVPEAEPALAFLRTFSQMKKEEQARVSDSFLNKITVFALDTTMKTMFGAPRPGVDWQQVIDSGTAVLFDFRHVPDLTRQRFLIWWYLTHFIEFVRTRGHGRHKPVSLIMDELTAFLNFQTLGPDPFLEDFDTLVNVITRSHGIWLTVCQQQAWQADPRIVKTLLSMGTQILGAVSDPDDARMLARHFSRYQPYLVKKREPVWMSDMPFGAYVVDETTVEFTPEEQEILEAYRFADTGKFTFLVRPATGEGDVRGRLRRISIANLDRDIWPHKELVEEARWQLSLRTGIPVVEVLDEAHHQLEGRAPAQLESRRGIVSPDAYEPVSGDLSVQEEEETPVVWE